MGCQSQVSVGDYLTFSICTHDPDTGELTDADAAPTYRIYEDETATAILTGTMAKLDDAHTTGFYTEQTQCSAANGFENWKSYTIYIEATVDGDMGGIAYTFVIRNPWAYGTRTLTQSAAEVAATVAGSSITVMRGNSWSISLTGLGSLVGRTKLWFTVKGNKSDADTAAIIQITEEEGLKYLNGAAGTAGNGSVTVDDEDDGDITIVLKAVETAKVRPASLHYDVQVLIAGVSTPTEGLLHVTDDVTRATS